MSEIAKRGRILLPLFLLAALLVGCNRSEGPAQGPDGTKYLLAKEPAGAKSVIAVREEAKDGDEVVIVGHIGGEGNPWGDGLVNFSIVDSSVKPCPPGEGCPTPWDCCCEPGEELK